MVEVIPKTTLSKPKALIIALTASLAFMMSSMVHLTSQGLYYDELHQAPSSFAYVHGKPKFFSVGVAEIKNIPLLNMPYSGAVKSGVYGLYLRLTGNRFTPFSWRMTGILFVTLGLVTLLYVLLRNFSLIEASVFFILFFTDISVLLSTRHDWGPTALAMLLRLLFIAIYLYELGSDKLRLRYILLLGIIIGLSLFEKLSSLVLLLPFVLLYLDRRRRNWKQLVCGGTGFLLGASPLIIVNLLTWYRSHYFISRSTQPDSIIFTFAKTIDYGYNFFSLGNGDKISQFILGKSPIIPPDIELLCILSILFCGMVFVLKQKNRDKYTYFLFSYFLIFIALYLLPKKTWVHHWIIGTPFQYIFIALIIGYLINSNKPANRTSRISRSAFILLLVMFGVIRVINWISIESELQSGSYSRLWDHSYTELAEFASKNKDDSIFIAATWGYATQIYCISGGNNEIVHEPFGGYPDRKYLQDLVSQKWVHTVYVLTSSDPADQSWSQPEQWPIPARQILDDIRSTPGLTEDKTDPVAHAFNCTHIFKFHF